MLRSKGDVDGYRIGRMRWGLEGRGGGRGGLRENVFLGGARTQNPQIFVDTHKIRMYNVRVVAASPKQGGNMRTKPARTATLSERPSRVHPTGIFLRRSQPLHTPCHSLPPKNHPYPGLHPIRAGIARRLDGSARRGRGRTRSRLSPKIRKNPLHAYPRAIFNHRLFFIPQKTTKSPPMTPYSPRSRPPWHAASGHVQEISFFVA
jgi:hypothetical protein